MERKFFVNPEVLIPRQETEELVMIAISKAGRSFSGTIIDFCTGTGCIAVTLALTIPGAVVWATDYPEETLHTAARNIDNHNAKVNLVRHDLLQDNLTTLPQASLIVANPPYVRESEKTLMAPMVVDFEPPAALYVPDSDPLIFYKALLEAIRVLLIPGGWFCFEINEALGDETLMLFTEPFITHPEIINDLNSKNRFISGTRTCE
jgi:release factor glutamine methyltransferase